METKELDPHLPNFEDVVAPLDDGRWGKGWAACSSILAHVKYCFYLPNDFLYAVQSTPLWCSWSSIDDHDMYRIWCLMKWYFAPLFFLLNCMSCTWTSCCIVLFICPHSAAGCVAPSVQTAQVVRLSLHLHARLFTALLSFTRTLYMYVDWRYMIISW